MGDIASTRWTEDGHRRWDGFGHDCHRTWVTMFLLGKSLQEQQRSYLHHILHVAERGRVELRRGNLLLHKAAIAENEDEYRVAMRSVENINICVVEVSTKVRSI